MNSGSARKHGKPKQLLGKKTKKENNKSKLANERGFQKRKIENQSKHRGNLDVYEYDEKDRKGRIREGVTLDLTKEEAQEYGPDDESEQDEFQKMRERIKMDGDGAINSEDDEDIDSDDAFDASDEERFVSFNFGSKKTTIQAQNSRPMRKEVNLDEDEEMEESEDHEDTNSTDEQMEKESEVDQDTEQESELSGRAPLENDLDLLPSEDEQDAEGALMALEGYIANITSKFGSEKRKASEMDDPSSEPPRQKRRVIREQTQAGIEGEFAPSRRPQQKLELADLIAPLAAEGPSASGVSISAVAKALKGSKAVLLAAPLPTRIQDRVDRLVAYEQTKTEVQKWEPTMRRIKEAEHLSFPLQTKPLHQGNLATISSTFKPANELESAVDRLLKAAELREEDIKKTEELEMQHLTVEEIAERRAELRRKRDLVFRAEIKAKRVAKIKSKAYRKMQKKERMKQAEKLKSIGEVVDDEEERMKAELDRAKERATLKHKTTGKWANSMRSKNELDGDQRNDMQEMYDRSEMLRKKIAGKDSEDDDESDVDEESVEESATRALRALDDIDEDLSRNSIGGKSGLMEMKFMKDAARRDEAQNKMTTDSFRHALENLGMSENDDAPTEPPRSTGVSRRGGRVSFQPGVSKDPIHPKEPSLDEDEIGQAENPWLAVDATSKRPRSKNSILVGKNSSAATLSKHSMNKQLQKNTESIARAKDDAQVEIDVNAVMTIPEKVGAKSKAPKAPRNNGTHSVDPTLVDEDEGSEDEGEITHNNRRSTAFEQRELVAKAFAGDNVVEEFATEKLREMETDAPKEIDTTLPGWGSWGGAGITKSAPKPERIKRFPGVDPKKRQDYGKDHVIISEKKDKKAEKYLVKDLPFPYTSKAQFDRRFEVPLGMEWNTRTTFQKATLPRVVKKMGTIIEPLEKLF
ncbi:hypothetical protein FRC15_011686 [Serendipita sp. 397]|nr:hypothetical protein FRC15_011686 [Serendipita sp. 397]